MFQHRRHLALPVISTQRRRVDGRKDGKNKERKCKIIKTLSGLLLPSCG